MREKSDGNKEVATGRAVLVTRVYHLETVGNNLTERHAQDCAHRRRSEGQRDEVPKDGGWCEVLRGGSQHKVWGLSDCNDDGRQ